uniref:Galactosylceramidase b n=1 Tax=Salmo trutta TaxID=8032 RepID=A0A674AZS5_SALTR
TLDKGGLEVRIIASDNLWQPITYSVLVDRYDGGPEDAEEDYSTFNDEAGGGCWARILNQNYVNRLMTAYVLFIYFYTKSHAPFNKCRTRNRYSPWFSPDLTALNQHKNILWRSALALNTYTTQFSQPGWTYMQAVGHLTHGGSYVTLTTHHSVCVRPPLLPFNVTPQNVTFQLNGSFVSIVTVIACLLMIKRLLCLSKRISDGLFTLSLYVDEVYTLTTITTGQKGTYPDPPPSGPFPKVYKDDFNAPDFADHTGVFEYYINLTDPGPHVFLHQVVTQMPVTWAADAEQTISVIGDYTWQNLTVSCDVFMETVKSGEVFIAARVDKGGGSGPQRQGSLLLGVADGSNKVTNGLGQYFTQNKFSKERWIMKIEVSGKNG